MSGTIQEEALRLNAAGYCVIPIRPDGSKRPFVRWKAWKQAERQYPFAAREFFPLRAAGIAVVGGPVSGNFEALDFDNHNGSGDFFPPWCDKIPTDLLRRLVIYRTPAQGWRACYRLPKNLAIVGDKEPLAQVPLELSGKLVGDTVIERLGSRLIFVPGGDPAAHPTGKPYEYVRGHLCDVQTLSGEEYACLLDAAWSLNTYFPPPPSLAKINFFTRKAAGRSARAAGLPATTSTSVRTGRTSSNPTAGRGAIARARPISGSDPARPAWRATRPPPITTRASSTSSQATATRSRPAPGTASSPSTRSSTTMATTPLLLKRCGNRATG
jgi:hypothetical protein